MIFGILSIELPSYFLLLVFDLVVSVWHALATTLESVPRDLREITYPIWGNDERE